MVHRLKHQEDLDTLKEFFEYYYPYLYILQNGDIGVLKEVEPTIRDSLVYPSDKRGPITEELRDLLRFIYFLSTRVPEKTEDIFPK